MCVFYFRAKLRELQMTERAFFEIAHWWQFQKQIDPAIDVEKYKKTGELPKYVVAYCKHLQES